MSFHTFASWFGIAVGASIAITFAVLVILRLRENEKLAKEPPRLGRWFFSGVAQSNNGAIVDAGCIRHPALMSTDEAIAKCSEIFPRAVIVHVDPDNFVITFKVV